MTRVIIELSAKLCFRPCFTSLVKWVNCLKLQLKDSFTGLNNLSRPQSSKGVMRSEGSTEGRASESINLQLVNILEENARLSHIVTEPRDFASNSYITHFIERPLQGCT